MAGRPAIFTDMKNAPDFKNFFEWPARRRRRERERPLCERLEALLNVHDRLFSLSLFKSPKVCQKMAIELDLPTNFGFF